MKALIFLTKTLLIFTILFPLRCFAHGEENPGPHGGVIRMPGLLHTEVLQVNPNSIEIYLLDLSFKNPTTENSQVKAKVDFNAKSTQLICNAVTGNNYFVCKASDPKLLENGNLIVTANRKGEQGADAIYVLPIHR